MIPGFTPPSVRRQLDDASALAQQLRRWAERQVGTELDLFPAEITGVSSGFHAWTEQAFDANADRYDKPGGREGTVDGVGGETVTWMPARMPDGTSLSDLPVQAWLIRAGLDTTASLSPSLTPPTGPNYEILGVVPTLEGETAIGEPQSSGVTPPTNYLDYRLVVLDVSTGNTATSTSVWVRDFNNPP